MGVRSENFGAIENRFGIEAVDRLDLGKAGELVTLAGGAQRAFDEVAGAQARGTDEIRWDEGVLAARHVSMRTNVTKALVGDIEDTGDLAEAFGACGSLVHFLYELCFLLAGGVEIELLGLGAQLCNLHGRKLLAREAGLGGSAVAIVALFALLTVVAPVVGALALPTRHMLASGGGMLATRRCLLASLEVERLPRFAVTLLGDLVLGMGANCVLGLRRFDCVVLGSCLGNLPRIHLLATFSRGLSGARTDLRRSAATSAAGTHIGLGSTDAIAGSAFRSDGIGKRCCGGGGRRSCRLSRLRCSQLGFYLSLRLAATTARTRLALRSGDSTLVGSCFDLIAWSYERLLGARSSAALLANNGRLGYLRERTGLSNLGSELCGSSGFLRRSTTGTRRALRGRLSLGSSCRSSLGVRRLSGTRAAAWTRRARRLRRYLGRHVLILFSHDT